MSLPLVMAATGAQPEAPATILETIIAQVAADQPGYTASLPGSLIEDISSTVVAAVALCDAAQVNSVNNLTPYNADPFILLQLGAIYGVPLGVGANTSVSMVFTGSVGFPIPVGFTVSDGTHQYQVQDGGIVESGGSSAPLFCLATIAGTWAVPPNTVANLITSVPSTITLSCNNPLAGTPSTGPQLAEDYQAQVIQAGKATAQGMGAFLKTQLENVSGVQARLVSVQQQSGGWVVLVGGGDPYAVAYAIWRGLFDITSLQLSTLTATAITNANPGVVTTGIPHGYTTGASVTIAGSTNVNFNVTETITVTGPSTFSLGIDTSGFGLYIGGGVLTPNLRNNSVQINDYPDVYTVPFVAPLQEVVTITLLWNTISTNSVSNVAMAAAGAPALVAYVNSIPAGQPMNLFGLQDAFILATASILPPALLTRMAFTVTISGVTVAPTAGTGIIAGDPLSYLFATVAGIVIAQG